MADKVDDSAFAAYVEGRGAGLRRIAFVIVRDWDAAEDVTQTALLKTYQRLWRIRADGLDQYVRSAVVNTAISQARARSRERTVPIEATSAICDDPDAASTHRDCMDLLGSIPEGRRAIIALRFLDDLSVGQVAAAMKISEGTVKSQTAKGLAQLRMSLASSPDKIGK